MRTNFAIPSDVILARWDNIITKLRTELAETPRWCFIKRRTILGAIASYRFEVEELESLVDSSEREMRLGRYSVFEKGARVQAKADAGFHQGAIGTVEFQEPGGLFRVWVLRDGTSGPSFYYPDELDLLDA